MRIYKIQRVSDGLFSTGGATPRWTKNGKTWLQLSHIKSHLTLIREERAYFKTRYHKDKSDPYDDAVVKIFEVAPYGTVPILNGEIP